MSHKIFVCVCGFINLCYYYLVWNGNIFESMSKNNFDSQQVFIYSK